MKTICEYIQEGYILRFSRNLIAMQWNSYELDSVVDSEAFAKEGDDLELLFHLERMAEELKKKVRKRERMATDPSVISKKLSVFDAHDF